jgi:hypothetical protein
MNLSERLRSNCPLQTQEEAELEDLAHQTHEEIIYLEAQLQQYESLRSPIRKLPLEVLTNIFRECTHKTYLCNAEECIVPSLRCAQVCSWWRSTVMSTPELWTSINISYMEVNHDVTYHGFNNTSIYHPPVVEAHQRRFEILVPFLWRNLDYPP